MALHLLGCFELFRMLISHQCSDLECYNLIVLWKHSLSACACIPNINVACVTLVIFWPQFQKKDMCEIWQVKLFLCF